ncbi:MAG: histidine kinase dimerization/phosphoacceptor domain -containing protein [Chitinophagaceae bacterium]
MTTRFLWLTGLLFASLFPAAQGPTRQDADSMFKALDKSPPTLERIDLLLNLAQYYIFKPGEYQVDFDSANVFINQATALNVRLKSPDAAGFLLLTEAYIKKEKGQRDEGRRMTEKAIGLLEKSTNKSYLGKAYYALSQYYDWSADDDQIFTMISLVEKSIVAFQQAGDLKDKAYSLKMLGDLENILGNNEKAIDALTRSLNAYDSIHYTDLQEVYALLGRTYNWQSDHKHALQYELLALNTALANHDSSMLLCAIYNNLGDIYNSLHQYKLSINYYLAAFEIAKKYDDSFAIIPLMASVASGYNGSLQHEKALEFLNSVPKKFIRPTNDEQKILVNIPYFTSYKDSKNPVKAKPYLDTLLKLASNKTLSNEMKSTVNRLAAGYYLKTKNYPVAQSYLTKNDTLVKNLGALRISLDLLLWYKIDSAQGNFRDAYEHLLSYKTIMDSIFNATRARQFQQLEVEYGTAKKQDSIKLMSQNIRLLEQDAILYESKMRQAMLIRNFTTGGIAMMLIITVLLYRQYRQKQKSTRIISQTNEIISQKNLDISGKNKELEHLVIEKEWLLKEVNHRVKNNLHTVICLLESQASYLKDDALVAIQDSQHRIYAMSLIHQKLYQSESMSIEMDTYLAQFIQYLDDSFSASNQIHFISDIHPITLSPSQAIPIALMVNEAVTNSIKYAFPNNKRGEINISLTESEHQMIKLVIADNGIGIDPEIMNRDRDSLGISLIKGLSKEIGATLSFQNDGGTKITITFMLDFLSYQE